MSLLSFPTTTPPTESSYADNQPCKCQLCLRIQLDFQLLVSLRLFLSFFVRNLTVSFRESCRAVRA